MPTVYAFGDSFSEDFDIFADVQNFNTLRYDYIHNHLNGEIPKTFAKLISEKLGYDYVCKAGAYGYEGNCNQSMYNNFFITSTNIKKDDIVFFGYTNPSRFKWYVSSSERIMTLLPNSYPVNSNESEKKAIDEFLINRDSDKWIDEYRKMEILIQELANCRGFKVFFWSYMNQFYIHLKNYIKNNPNWLLGKKIIEEYNYDLNGFISQFGYHDIKHETNQKNNDSHYGRIGHEILSKLFLEEIKILI